MAMSCLLEWCVLALVAQAAMYGRRSGVEELESASFKKAVTKNKGETGQLPWMMEFYAPWCGHCRNLKPEYEKLAKKLAGIVNIGAVDCDVEQNKPLAARFGVQGFPTLKVFKPGSKVPIDYNGPRKAGAMANFVLTYLPNKVTKVDDLSIDSFLDKVHDDTNHVLLVTRKRTVTPLYKSVAARLGDRLQFGQMLHTQEFRNKVGATSFPTLVVITGKTENEYEYVTYDGALNVGDLTNFLRPFASTDAAEDGTAETKFVVPIASKEDYAKTVESSHAAWMVVFHQAWDQAKELQVEWAKAGGELKRTIFFASVDCSKPDGEALAAELGITSFPAIIGFRTGDKSSNHVYEGKHKASKLVDFAKTLLYDNVEVVKEWLPHSVTEKIQLVLFTAMRKLPLLYRAIASELKDEEIEFLVELKTTEERMKRLDPSASLPTIMAFQRKNKESQQLSVGTYQGPISADGLHSFVRKFTEELGTASVTLDPDTAIPITSQAEFESNCLKKLGLCALGFTGASDDEAAELAIMDRLADKWKNRGLFHFGLVDRTAFPWVAEAFRLSDGYFNVIVLQPRKLRYAFFVGSFSFDNLDDFLDLLLKGKLPTTELEALPSFDAPEATPGHDEL